MENLLRNFEKVMQDPAREVVLQQMQYHLRILGKVCDYSTLSVTRLVMLHLNNFVDLQYLVMVCFLVFKYRL